jgi:CsgH protein
MVAALAVDAFMSLAFAKAALVASAPLLATTAASDGPDSVRCWVRASVVAQGLQLDAMGVANMKVVGNYQLRVEKSSMSGTSLNMQSGGFVLGPTPRSLSTIVLDRSAIGHYKATLSLNWDGGHISCVAP